MAMTAVYTNFCGMIVHQSRNGVERDIIPDPLGSVAHLVDEDQNITASYTYTPYGEVESHSGEETPLNFVGTLGYYRDTLVSKLTYIRARWYKAEYGRWMTVDILWPDESAFNYCAASPGKYFDRTGRRPNHRCDALVLGCKQCATKICLALKNAKGNGDNTALIIGAIGGGIVGGVIGSIVPGPGTVAGGIIGGVGGGVAGGLVAAAIEICLRPPDVDDLCASIFGMCDQFAYDCPRDQRIMCYALALKRCRNLQGTDWSNCRDDVWKKCTGSDSPPVPPPIKGGGSTWIFPGAGFEVPPPITGGC